MSLALSGSIDGEPLTSVSRGQFDYILSPSQPQGITARWLVSNYTARWQTHACVNNFPRVALDSGEARIRTRDLLIASRKSSVLTTIGHRATLMTGMYDVNRQCISVDAHVKITIDYRWRSVVAEQEQLAIKALNLVSVFGEVDRLKEENNRLEKMCNNLTRDQVKTVSGFFLKLNVKKIHKILCDSLHCTLASGAVYCNRSCLCVCNGRAGGRCPNLTTASARSVCVSLGAFLIVNMIDWANWASTRVTWPVFALDALA